MMMFFSLFFVISKFRARCCPFQVCIFESCGLKASLVRKPSHIIMVRVSSVSQPGPQIGKGTESACLSRQQRLFCSTVDIDCSILLLLID